MSLQQSTKLLEQLKQSAAERVNEASRIEAWKSFLTRGLPKKQDEAFRYLSLRELYEETFYKARTESSYQIEPPEEGVCRIVLIDGVLSKEHSALSALPKEVVLCTLEEAYASYGSLLRSRARKVLKEDHSSSFSFLNSALYDEGMFLYVPPKQVVEKRVEILELYSSSCAAMYFPKFSIYLGKQAQVTFDLHVKTHEKELTHFINRCIEFHMEADSHCRVHQCFLNIGKCWYFDQISIYLKRDASCFYISGDRGSKLLRQDFRVELLEENAGVTLKGLSILQGKNQSHHHVQIKHLAPHCNSSQQFRGVMFDQSMLSFEGKIWVDPIAQKTEAYQQSNHLILGEYARAYSKPNLEIFADDVKASHGATVAQLSEEEIFYLLARGLEPSLAKKILVRGFCKTLLEEMRPASRQEMMIYLQQGLDA